MVLIYLRLDHLHAVLSHLHHHGEEVDAILQTERVAVQVLLQPVHGDKRPRPPNTSTGKQEI